MPTTSTSPRDTTNMALSSPTVSLDYNKCTPTELGTFIRNRSSLKPSDSEELVHFPKSHLTPRLNMLDKHSRVGFLDLPPELRLEVYQYVLVARNCEALGAGDRVIETSLLRTCKLVYKETEPVLYGENEFTVSISLAPEPWSSLYACSLSPAPYRRGRHCVGIVPSGHPTTNNYSQDRSTNYGPFITHMASCSCFNVLRRIRHLTLLFGSLPTKAREEFAAICSILSGASRLKTLTIVLDEQRREDVNMKDLAATFWSVALLRGKIQLEFKSEVKAVEAKLAKGYDTLYRLLEHYRDSLRQEPYHGLEALGDLISKARNQEARLAMAKEDREDRKYLRRVVAVLDKLLPWLVMPTAVDESYIRIELWITLQGYVNEDPRSLR